MNEIIQILEVFLGAHRTHYSHNGQVTFNCPNCDNGRNKGNLEVNYKRNVFSCWSCRELDEGVRGTDIRWLVYKYASRELFHEYNKLKPNFDDEYKKLQIDVTYPIGFKNFNPVNDKSLQYGIAKNYLHKRGLNDNIIQKFNLGFCDEGEYNGRIIIPSYDKFGDLNYFIGRDYTGNSKIKYLNQTNSKQELIFNEYSINWDASVFIVEGVFDHLVLYNSIPILGKSVSNLLMHNLQKKLKGNLFILLDSDATKDAEKLYTKLNFGNLRSKIFIIDLHGDDDVSSVYQKTKDKKFYNLLIEGVREIY